MDLDFKSMGIIHYIMNNSTLFKKYGKIILYNDYATLFKSMGKIILYNEYFPQQTGKKRWETGSNMALYVIGPIKDHYT